jgi:hypothetical protein
MDRPITKATRGMLRRPVGAQFEKKEWLETATEVLGHKRTKHFVELDRMEFSQLMISIIRRVFETIKTEQGR